MTQKTHCVILLSINTSKINVSVSDVNSSYQVLATLSKILATVATGCCHHHSTTQHTMKLAVNNKKYLSISMDAGLLPR